MVGKHLLKIQSLVPNFTMSSNLQIEMHQENCSFMVTSISFLFVKILAALGLRCYVQAFSSRSEGALLSGWDGRSSHGGGFSCCGAQTLGCLARRPLCCRVDSYHWTVKETPAATFTHLYY